jgi:hypothetical protein
MPRLRTEPGSSALLLASRPGLLLASQATPDVKIGVNCAENLAYLRFVCSIGQDGDRCPATLPLDECCCCHLGDADLERDNVPATSAAFSFNRCAVFQGVDQCSQDLVGA